MSGRDLRAFLSSHRSGTFHTKGSGSSAPETICKKHLVGTATKIMPVDYEQVLFDIQCHKDSVHAGFKRFKSITKKGKETKETSLLKKHHEIWSQEHTKLSESWSKALSELNQWRGSMLASGELPLKKMLTVLTTFESELHDSQEEFKELTLKPVWCVRTDLKGLARDPSLEKEPSLPLEQIMVELKIVKEQQKVIQKLLQEELETVESELDHFMDEWGVCNHGNVLVVKEMKPIVKPLTSVIVNLECPDEDFLSNVQREFHCLDDQFTSLLAEWRECNQHVLSCSYGGWSQYEAECFHHLLQQHPPSLTNRRKLYMDRALREFPHKSRPEIVAHESWQLSLKHYIVMRRRLLSVWADHREELAVKMVEVCEEVCHAHQAAVVARIQRDQWRQRCDRLYHKVQAWREEKMELQRAEAERVAKQQALEEEKRQQEERRQQRKRECDKAQLKQYHLAMQSRHHDNLEQARRLEEAANVEKKKLGSHHIKRVEFRQERLLEKAAQVREAKTLEMKEAAEKEKRLDLLRQQVHVETTFDPERVLQSTVASEARASSFTDQTHSELYKLHGYVSDKITSDPRVRLECALREAGLHTTRYARAVLSRVPPPRPPRPDQASTLFKDT